MVDLPVNDNHWIQIFVRNLQRVTLPPKNHSSASRLELLRTAVVSLPHQLPVAEFLVARSLTAQVAAGLCRGGTASEELATSVIIKMCESGTVVDLANAVSTFRYTLDFDAVHGDQKQRDCRLVLAIALIERKLSDPNLRLRTTANECGLSSWHLERIFKAEVGIGFRRYVRLMRIRTAQSLLASTLLSIKEIAAQVGYSYAADLTRTFRAVTGKTPSSWRKQSLS